MKPGRKPKIDGFIIEDNIPMIYHKRLSRSSWRELPLESMRIGQSVLLEKATETNINSRQTLISSAVRRVIAERKLGQEDFRIGRHRPDKLEYEDQVNIRIWRIK